MMRQKLASVLLGSPSLTLRRRNGFSPVRMRRCGSATVICFLPCEGGRSAAARRSESQQLRLHHLRQGAKLVQDELVHALVHLHEADRILAGRGAAQVEARDV